MKTLLGLAICGVIVAAISGISSGSGAVLAEKLMGSIGALVFILIIYGIVKLFKAGGKDAK
ncbi:hypothetical protein [Sutterella wadsworthensis]|uniref:hypothetical protein n=1 Tax=Sutterella wadsworthensis TaxID=40545 RepID=UPI0013F67BE2|nr:hypothetical protein [Sutterella wadsworthensis]MBT9622201.1 hypothetical protein [Sutterella wadsworthensis]